MLDARAGLTSSEAVPLEAAQILRDQSVSQRWRNGRSSFVVPGEVFDPSRACVVAIDEATAKAYVTKNHYSGSYPAARFRVGLYVKNRFMREELCGVAVYSVPMTQAVIPSYFDGLAPADGIELGRLVLDDAVPFNAESWMVARANRLLVKDKPNISGVLAYCDPVERRSADGNVTKVGHRGTIYRALNAQYRGRSAARTLWISPAGQSYAGRMLSKLSLDERGAAYAQQRLEEAGAPARWLKESGDAWVRRLKACGWLSPLRHPGNYAFTFQLRAPHARRSA